MNFLGHADGDTVWPNSEIGYIDINYGNNIRIAEALRL